MEISENSHLDLNLWFQALGAPAFTTLVCVRLTFYIPFLLHQVFSSVNLSESHYISFYFLLLLREKNCFSSHFLYIAFLTEDKVVGWYH